MVAGGQCRPQERNTRLSAAPEAADSRLDWRPSWGLELRAGVAEASNGRGALLGRQATLDWRDSAIVAYEEADRHVLLPLSTP